VPIHRSSTSNLVPWSTTQRRDNQLCYTAKEIPVPPNLDTRYSRRPALLEARRMATNELGPDDEAFRRQEARSDTFTGTQTSERFDASGQPHVMSCGNAGASKSVTQPSRPLTAPTSQNDKCTRVLAIGPRQSSCLNAQRSSTRRIPTTIGRTYLPAPTCCKIIGIAAHGQQMHLLRNSPKRGLQARPHASHFQMAHSHLPGLVC
jgi:hypothetical protein